MTDIYKIETQGNNEAISIHVFVSHKYFFIGDIQHITSNDVIKLCGLFGAENKTIGQYFQQLPYPLLPRRYILKNLRYG